MASRMARIKSAVAFAFGAHTIGIRAVLIETHESEGQNLLMEQVSRQTGDFRNASLLQTGPVETVKWPVDYESKGAVEKLNFLWDQTLRLKDLSGGWPSVSDSIWMIDRYSPWRWDVVAHPGMLPSDNFQDLPSPAVLASGPRLGPDHIPKTKLIHSVGVVAKVKFNWLPAARKYTGSFRGAEHAIARFSSAAEPSGGQCTPALAVKVLRNGKPSGNFMAMHKLDATDDLNFFAHPLATHVPTVHSSTPVKLLVSRFSKALSNYNFEEHDGYPSMIGLKDFAAVEESGREVPLADRKAPWVLYFEPKKAVKDLYGTLDVDATTGLKGFGGRPANLAANQALYDVFALENPGSYMQPEKIGELVFLDGLFKSRFGDEHLLFKHVFMENEELKQPYASAWKTVSPDAPGECGYNDCAEVIRSHLS
eukprot:TRINITY_DN29152_c0_g1_i2.p1 TRINITY_DN29152_c0_g1~~TRINITY_DN29152_c0_g1_i2.p1  ORF type:complete len:423 (-),score=34.56 TRINITY_DN29152_c0_g1_i2:67-1335(-)